MAFDYVRDGLITCPTCETDDFDVLSASTTFPAVRCRSCGLGIERYVRLDPSQYDATVYEGARDGGAGTAAETRWHHDVAVATKRIKQLADVLPDKATTYDTWVDVGCGAGAVPVVAERHGYHAVGVEVDPATVTAPVHAVSWKSWLRDGTGSGYTPPGSMRVLSAFDVIEHMLDPTALIRSAASRTAILVIEVPDLDKAGDFTTWKHRRVRESFTEHVYHFSTDSLKKMVARYAPSMTFIRSNEPVPGKLQAVWKS